MTARLNDGTLRARFRYLSVAQPFPTVCSNEPDRLMKVGTGTSSSHFRSEMLPSAPCDPSPADSSGITRRAAGRVERKSTGSALPLLGRWRKPPRTACGRPRLSEVLVAPSRRIENQLWRAGMVLIEVEHVHDGARHRVCRLIAETSQIPVVFDEAQDR